MIAITPEQAKKFTDGYKMLIYCSVDGLSKYHEGIGFIGTVKKFYHYLELDEHMEFDKFVELVNKMIDEELISCKEMYQTKDGNIYGFYTNNSVTEIKGGVA